MTMILYYIVGVFMLISAAMTIIASNLVHSVFYLITTFVNASVLLVLIGAEYLAIIFLIVYVGAVAILFLFVVMMWKDHKIEGRSHPVGILLALAFIYELLTIIQGMTERSTDQHVWLDWGTLIVGSTNINQIGVEITPYLLLVGCILLLAMIGAIVLTVDHGKLIQRQDFYAQIATAAASKFYSRWNQSE